MKSTNDVLDHHLKAIEHGDVNAVLSDYAPDAVLFRSDGVLTDDVQAAFLAILTNEKVTEDKVGPHGDLLDEFPYLGPPHDESK
jgi:ketosteroid isomerase-like protein